MLSILKKTAEPFFKKYLLSFETTYSIAQAKPQIKNELNSWWKILLPVSSLCGRVGNKTVTLSFFSFWTNGLPTVKFKGTWQETAEGITLEGSIRISILMHLLILGIALTPLILTIKALCYGKISTQEDIIVFMTVWAIAGLGIFLYYNIASDALTSTHNKINQILTKALRVKSS